jgi:hypothetical protein
MNAMCTMPDKFAILVATFLLIPGLSCPQSPSAVIDVANRYPNELVGFKFFETAPWRSLVPLVSTMKDVRRTLGSPVEASDVSSPAKPYPGDERARAPILTYRLNPEWDVLVSFTRYCFLPHAKEIPGDRLCSIDLIPTKRVPFNPAKLSSSFKKRHVDAVDASWDEYSDGSGLRYDIYTGGMNYGKLRPGDLRNISYGPPARKFV